MSRSKPPSLSVLDALLATTALAITLLGLAAGPASGAQSVELGASTSDPVITPRIIDGEVAPPDSWRSQAALLQSSVSNPTNAQFCGGTLIRPTWVLTAAHCVDLWSSPSQIEVAIGINNKSDILGPDRMDVQQFFSHPDWDPNTFEWDFALLKLASASAQPTTDLITPAEAEETAAGKPGRIAGWGCTLQVTKEDCGPMGGYPDDLLQASVQFVSDADCGSAGSYGSDFDPVMMICAGIYPAGGKDTCFGDSGGPLTANVGTRRVLAGITSWGAVPCGLPDLPGIYARVTAGLPWIRSIIGPDPEAKIGSVTVTGPGKVRRGRSVSYRATIRNVGTATATGVRLAASGRGLSVNTPVGPIGAGASRTVTLRVKFRRVGKLKVTFRATSTNGGSKQTSKTVRVVR